MNESVLGWQFSVFSWITAMNYKLSTNERISSQLAILSFQLDYCYEL